MITVPKLKINTFKQVSIPSPAELFSRFGFSNKKGTYTGDDKALNPQSKVEICAAVEKLAIDPDKE